MSPREEIVMHGTFLVKRMELLRDLRYIRGLDESVPFNELVFTSSRREIGDAVRQYVYSKFDTYNIIPTITDQTLRQAMQSPIVKIHFTAVFADNHALNLYKLKKPNEYDLMRGKYAQ